MSTSLYEGLVLPGIRFFLLRMVVTTDADGGSSFPYKDLGEQNSS